MMPRNRSGRLLEAKIKINTKNAMIYKYNGHYSYNKDIVSSWNSTTIGVYYCGYPLNNGNLLPLYIGRAIGQGGIRERLLQHLNEDEWTEVSHFGYVVCDTAREADSFEAKEIVRCTPRYNKQGV